MNEWSDANIELPGILVVVVILVLYIVPVIGQVSAGAMAVDVGVREAVRILAEDPDRTADANHAVILIVENFGVNTTPEVASTCKSRQDGEGTVGARVSVQVPLPLMPVWFGGLGVDASSNARTPVWEVAARE